MSTVDRLRAAILSRRQIAEAAVCQCGGRMCTLELGWCRMDEAEDRLGSKNAARFVVENSPASVIRAADADMRMLETVENGCKIGLSGEIHNSWTDLIVRNLATRYGVDLNGESDA